MDLDSLSNRLWNLNRTGVLLLIGMLCVPVSASDRLNLHRVTDYKVLNDKTLIISAAGKKKYLAELFSHCFGLRSADTLAFITRGGNDLDSFSSVVLPDGSRCRFKTFNEIPNAPTIPLQDQIER